MMIQMMHDHHDEVGQVVTLGSALKLLIIYHGQHVAPRLMTLTWDLAVGMAKLATAAGCCWELLVASPLALDLGTARFSGAGSSP